MPIAGATRSRPASSALRPWTIWKYWVRKKNVTNIANSTMPIRRTAPARSRSRRKRRGSIGVLARASTTAKTTSEHGRGSERAQHGALVPSDLATSDDPVDQRGEAHGAEDRAGQVETDAAWVA